MERIDVEIKGIKYPAFLLTDTLRLRHQDSFNTILEHYDGKDWNSMGFFQNASGVKAFVHNYTLWHKLRRTRFTEGFWRDVDYRIGGATETQRVLVSLGLAGIQKLIIELRLHKKTEEENILHMNEMKKGQF